MNDTLYVLVSKNSPNLEVLEVLENREKSLKVENKERRGLFCFLPKSGLELSRPGEKTYENEYVLKPWFRGRLNSFQERVLGILG